MDIRVYKPGDRGACLSVFDSLTPAPAEATARADFEAWLDGMDGEYFVMEHEGTVVGCGGYSLSADRSTAALRWGMIRSSAQRMGLGRFLLMYRIREIGKAGSVSVVRANVPGESAGFFEKQGFRLNGAEWVKKLTVCS